jgi:hypothetical protein
MKTLVAVVAPGFSSCFPRAFRSGLFVAESFDFIRGRLSWHQLFPPAIHQRTSRANLEGPGTAVRPVVLLLSPSAQA